MRFPMRGEPIFLLCCKQQRPRSDESGLAQIGLNAIGLEAVSSRDLILPLLLS